MAERRRIPMIRGEHVYLRPEGTLRNAHDARGAHEDVHVMSLLRDEWLALPHRRSWEYD